MTLLEHKTESYGFDRRPETCELKVCILDFWDAEEYRRTWQCCEEDLGLEKSTQEHGQTIAHFRNRAKADIAVAISEFRADHNGGCDEEEKCSR